MKPVSRSWFLIFALIAGCASLGLPTPTTFKERLAAAYSTVEGVRSEADALLLARRITPDDAQSIQNQATSARSALDVASLAFIRDPAAADTKLTATITALTALQGYLASRRGK